MPRANDKARSSGEPSCRALANAAFRLLACEASLICRKFRMPEMGLDRYGIPMLDGVVTASFALVACCRHAGGLYGHRHRVAKCLWLAVAALCTSLSPFAQLFFGQASANV